MKYHMIHNYHGYFSGTVVMSSTLPVSFSATDIIRELREVTNSTE